MNRLINAVRQRRGVALRDHKDFEVGELQIYFEAFERRVGRQRGFYYGFTRKSANESYTVERRRTRQVPDGKDKDGNTTYRTEVYYVYDTVTPSFENILGDYYDTGDRSVSGLENIRRRTRAMREREGTVRDRIASAENFIEDVLRRHLKTHSNLNLREEFLSKFDRWLSTLETLIPQQRAYSQWSDSQIRGQYDKDILENFRGRNRWMLSRLENMKDLMLNLRELVRRQEASLYPALAHFDLSGYMKQLRRYRNGNYQIKSAIFLTALGNGVGYHFYHNDYEFAEWLRNWVPFLADFFSWLGG